MSREYPEHPIVGVAAVVLRAGQVLLVQRGREPAKGLWGLPGGMLELGETVAEGVRREVWEECGVEIEVGPLVGVFEPMQRDDAGRLRYHYGARRRHEDQRSGGQGWAARSLARWGGRREAPALRWRSSAWSSRSGR